MKKALIITGGYINIKKITVFPENYDIIIAADSGYISADKLNISPRIVVGDFDSAIIPETDARILISSTEKDETDTALACNVAVEHGAKEILILGGTGGRADHFIANIILLEALKDKNISAVLTDGENTIRIINDEIIKIPNKNGYFSVFALDGCSVTIKDCKYPLENFSLSRSNPLCVSNEVIGDFATVSVKGKAIICESKK